MKETILVILCFIMFICALPLALVVETCFGGGVVIFCGVLIIAIIPIAFLWKHYDKKGKELYERTHVFDLSKATEGYEEKYENICKGYKEEINYRNILMWIFWVPILVVLSDDFSENDLGIFIVMLFVFYVILLLFAEKNAIGYYEMLLKLVKNFNGNFELHSKEIGITEFITKDGLLRLSLYTTARRLSARHHDTTGTVLSRLKRIQIKVTNNKNIKEYVKIGIKERKRVEDDLEDGFYIESNDEEIKKSLLINDLKKILIEFIRKYKIPCEIMLEKETVIVKLFTTTMFNGNIAMTTRDKQFFYNYYCVIKLILELSDKIKEIIEIDM